MVTWLLGHFANLQFCEDTISSTYKQGKGGGGELLLKEKALFG
jgi:hypothetical protein